MFFDFKGFLINFFLIHECYEFLWYNGSVRSEIFTFFLYFTDILVILSNPFSMIRNQCDSLGQSRGKALKF